MRNQKLLQLLRDNSTTERKPLNLVRNEADNDATLYIYDVIDAWWGVAAAQVAPQIAALDPSTTLHVRVNSPGGDVFEGRAIRTAIKQFKGKTIGHIDGLAASAATTVVDACDEIEIVEGGFYMIHNGWTITWGNKHEMRKTADLLDKVDGAIVADYAKRTGLDVAQLVKWMDDETWFDASESIEHGFASRLAADPDKAAVEDASGRRWNLSAYEKAPKALIAPATPPADPDPEPDFAAQRARNERRLRVFQIA
ncbi:protease/scaffold protein [Variovorax phage VarioGold]|uniref:head maturation protease, ClpP-related n=1 Tax=Variovorax sp. ZS18.2.2 TaxID=2971255 RepID=UPI002150FF30|nr:head maturation protease, ClpP-related [Variovorax sp. ZS18.2.2]MCR6477533.1 Clp protease ClpP [Variovorax sp. ZS18.2.2]UYD72052.1 protease/scaffold protein [Variovorax phage VarioGold]